MRKKLISNSQLDKNRIMLSCICFLSLLPTFFTQALQLAINLFQPEVGSLLNILLSIGFICNNVIAQLIEELCLIIFCKDLRKLIRQQFRYCFGPSPDEVTSIAVSTNSINVRSSNNNIQNQQTENNNSVRIRTIVV